MERGGASFAGEVSSIFKQFSVPDKVLLLLALNTAEAGSTFVQLRSDLSQSRGQQLAASSLSMHLGDLSNSGLIDRAEKKYQITDYGRTVLKGVEELVDKVRPQRISVHAGQIAASLDPDQLEEVIAELKKRRESSE